MEDLPFSAFSLRNVGNLKDRYFSQTPGKIATPVRVIWLRQEGQGIATGQISCAAKNARQPYERRRACQL
jgi:hypothetical protein